MGAASLAVIVPVYNRRVTVLDALSGVAAQSLRPSRLVVVDDGSTDGSGECVGRWIAARGPGFECTVVRQENRGASAARNRGMAAAGDCELTAFLDSDDIWPTDFLQRTCQALSSCPAAVAATCNRRFTYPDDPQGRISNVESLAANATTWLFLHDGGLASASLFRSDRVKTCGGFNEHLGVAEDTELFFRLSLLGPWLHVPGAPVVFRREVAESRGEAGNLSLHYSDTARRTARVYEDFVVRQGGKEVLPRRLYNQVLSKWWYRAGRELMRAHRRAEAADCFRRSLSWRFHTKAWLRLAQIRLARAA